jgi:hypothetical protein
VSPTPAPAEPAPGPGHAILPRRSLTAAVAKAIARAQAERRFGCYDYSRYPGDAPPYVIRDEIARREVYRSWNHAECQARYVEVEQTYIAECVLGAIVEFYRG